MTAQSSLAPTTAHQSAAPVSIMDVIARAAADPNTDVDKLERLLAMHERVMQANAVAEFNAALVEVKPKLPVIDRKGRIEVRAKSASGERNGAITQSTPYALWEDIDAAITDILAEHGLVLTFRSGVAQDGKITVTGVLSHKGGHSEQTTITLPHDSSGSKNAVQAVGSSTSYGKRYTATLLLNIRTKGEDDDGKTGGAAGTITDDQVLELREAIAAKGFDIIKFCKFFKVDALADIKAGDFSKAMNLIKTTKGRT